MDGSGNPSGDWPESRGSGLVRAGRCADVVSRPSCQSVKTGITTVSMGTKGAQLTNYDLLVDQADGLWTANFDGPTRYIMAPRARALKPGIRSGRLAGR